VLFGPRPRRFDHLGREVEAEDAACGAYLLGQRKGRVTDAAGEVEDAVAGVRARQRASSP